MAATNSGHRHHHNHPPKFVVTDRGTYPTDDEDSDDFESWNTNKTEDEHQEKAISKPTVTKRKLPRKTHRRHEKTVPVAGKSLPVNIPEWSKILRDSDTLRSSNGDDVDGGDDEWLPPHEYLARIRSASLSVHEGVGRTLKGRDLRRLRNAIWKQTGFELD
ncbi:hypothetical protein L1987_10190 [Smallanthus sonchifolius]|uniref:Uncharacterized protein n=1 Tax=Smallanthus sonchifolius TaxID=185202 RepID=A0ACB9JRD7_9ASTR|nr:hypothetical protein L1987_10190 [Smallanthus sonchifolius]